MLLVALTGGLASGKSFVARTLQSLGCHVIHADELGHQVLAPGGPGYQAAVEAFGPGILDEDGAINRRKLAAEVFDAPERLARLNSIVHPHVFQLQADRVRAIARTDPRAIIVAEAAIHIETGSHTKYEKLILAYCREEQQIERAMERGMTRQEVEARLRRQIPLADKRRYADFLIDTSGSKESTVAQTEAVHGELRRLEEEKYVRVL